MTLCVGSRYPFSIAERTLTRFGDFTPLFPRRSPVRNLLQKTTPVPRYPPDDYAVAMVQADTDPLDTRRSLVVGVVTLSEHDAEGEDSGDYEEGDVLDQASIIGATWGLMDRLRTGLGGLIGQRLLIYDYVNDQTEADRRLLHAPMFFGGMGQTEQVMRNRGTQGWVQRVIIHDAQGREINYPQGAADRPIYGGSSGRPTNMRLALGPLFIAVHSSAYPGTKTGPAAAVKGSIAVQSHQITPARQLDPLALSQLGIIDPFSTSRTQQDADRGFQQIAGEVKGFEEDPAFLDGDWTIEGETGWNLVSATMLRAGSYAVVLRRRNAFRV